MARWPMTRLEDTPKSRRIAPEVSRASAAKEPLFDKRVSRKPPRTEDMAKPVAVRLHPRSARCPPMVRQKRLRRRPVRTERCHAVKGERQAPLTIEVTWSKTA